MMTEVTTKLLVLETRGGPLGVNSGLTERDLSEWLGVEEDRVADLKDKII